MITLWTCYIQSQALETWRPKSCWRPLPCQATQHLLFCWQKRSESPISANELYQSSHFPLLCSSAASTYGTCFLISHSAPFLWGWEGHCCTVKKQRFSISVRDLKIEARVLATHSPLTTRTVIVLPQRETLKSWCLLCLHALRIDWDTSSTIVE